ncbi:MAG: M48 family metalloprotease [Terriglobia bacterium]|jgi:Zn-dependent protease with chaperone function
MMKRDFSTRAVIAVLLLALNPTLSSGTVRDPRKEGAIEGQLAGISPQSVEVFKQATKAMDEGSAEQSARLFEKVLTKAPDFDPAVRRLGFSLIKLGQREKGMQLLERALSLQRSSENLISLASQLAYPDGGKASRAEEERALLLLNEAWQIDNDQEALFMRAQLSLDLRNEGVFREATRQCMDLYPKEMGTHYFNAIRAAMDEEWIESENEIKRAGELGLDPKVVRSFLESGVHSHVQRWRFTFYALYFLAAWALGLVLIFLLGKAMSKMTMHALKEGDPNELNKQLGAHFKKVYRILINFAGVYYYISLPVLIFLLVGLACSVFYACFLLGRWPIKLLVMLGVVTVATIYQMIRTLFIRPTLKDPGRALKQEEAPGLWQLVGQVAQKVGTRAIEEIRITPGTDLAVYEKGSGRQRARDQANRILILGVGVLYGFQQNAFRAVIAHEYGHFSHRDTAGGDAAMRVNTDMTTFAIAILMQGLAVWYNIAFQFLRLYHFLFRRISHGASRLQEVMADIVAVKLYGATAFEEGLRHVVFRDTEFSHTASQINSSREFQTAAHLRTLFEPSSSSPAQQRFIARDAEKNLNCPTSEDDTHPAPCDRFALARRIHDSVLPEEDGFVWDLFVDKVGLTQEMVQLLCARLGMASAGTQ